MKNFDYYRENPHEYFTAHNVEKELLKELDEQPLTKDERIKKEKEAKQLSYQLAREKNKPYHEFSSQRDAEFWKDCREDLGYDCYNKQVTEIIESKAWSEGHSSGYSEVYSKLQDILEFVENLFKAK